MTSKTIAIVCMLPSLLLLGCAEPNDEDDGDGDDIVVPRAVGFTCDHAETASQRSLVAPAHVISTQTTRHPGFDRFVVQFSRGDRIPTFRVARQKHARFHRNDTGTDLDLPGASGISVTLRDAVRPAADMATDFVSQDVGAITRIAGTGAVDGTVGWGLGVVRPSCYRVLERASPPRLVIDIQDDPTVMAANTADEKAPNDVQR